MSKTERPPIGEWGGLMGLVYGQFENENDPGVEYFNLFRNMVREMKPSALKPNDNFQNTVSFGGKDFFLSFGINFKKTFENDDYVPIIGKMLTESLQATMKKEVSPFWIEILGTWSTILFTDGKWNYKAEIVLDQKK